MFGTVDYRLVRRLGLDEHRFRRVRLVRNPSGKILRFEPCSVEFTDLDADIIFDVRRAAMVLKWISQPPRNCRQRAQYVATDMSTDFRKVIRAALPRRGSVWPTLPDIQDQRDGHQCAAPLFPGEGGPARVHDRD